jgi:hypothetical protein
MHALGGSDIPNFLLSSTSQPRRQWGDDGNIKQVQAIEFGLPPRIACVLSGKERLGQAIEQLGLTEKQLDHGTTTWSLRPGPVFDDLLSSETKGIWEATALQLVCFACPPCGDTLTWYVSSSVMSNRC